MGNEVYFFIIITFLTGCSIGYKFCMMSNKVTAIMALSKLLIRLLNNEVTSKEALKEIEEIEKL